MVSKAWARGGETLEREYTIYKDQLTSLSATEAKRQSVRSHLCNFSDSSLSFNAEQNFELLPTQARVQVSMR